MIQLFPCRLENDLNVLLTNLRFKEDLKLQEIGLMFDFSLAKANK